MRKISLIILLISSFFIFGLAARAQNQINLYFFYGDGCPHCAKEEKFLNQLETENKNIKIYRYEVWHSQDNAKLLSKLSEGLKLDIKGVPVLIIGDQSIVGYYDDQTTGSKIKSLIDDYTLNGCTDIVAPILNNSTDTCTHGCDENDSECLHNCGCSAGTQSTSEKIPDKIKIPLVGEIDLKNYSLLGLTALIGITDGFNPCAMWVLLFLISLLIGMKNKTRMWVLGSAFIVASGLVYFLFLTAWLNLFLFLGFVFWIRAIIALVALGSGGYQLYEFYKNRAVVCVVEQSDKRKKVFARLREITAERNFWLALAGIVALAFAVNLVELVCSAGLPAIYTQVLALAHLPAWQYYAYMLLYILFFMIDDLLVYFIAMKTLQIKAGTMAYGKYSGVVGGVIMVLIGLLLLFKPGWLMFG